MVTQNENTEEIQDSVNEIDPGDELTDETEIKKKDFLDSLDEKILSPDPQMSGIPRKARKEWKPKQASISDTGEIKTRTLKNRKPPREVIKVIELNYMEKGLRPPVWSNQRKEFIHFNRDGNIIPYAMFDPDGNEITDDNRFVWDNLYKAQFPKVQKIKPESSGIGFLERMDKVAGIQGTSRPTPPTPPRPKKTAYQELTDQYAPESFGEIFPRTELPETGSYDSAVNQFAPDYLGTKSPNLANRNRSELDILNARVRKLENKIGRTRRKI